MILEASVIVPTKNRAALLAHTLHSLCAQDFPADRFEIVVVDDGSEPSIAPAVESVRRESGPEIRLIRHAHSEGPNAARNTGAREARSDLLCYIDDDIDAPAGWMRALVEGADRNPDADCLGGPIRVRFEGQSALCIGCGAGGETELELKSAEGPIDECLYSANMAIRRSALDVAGPLDASLPIYFEEVEWQHRLRDRGGSVYYLPEAWLWHRRTPADLRVRHRLRRNFRFGYAQARYMKGRGEPIRAGRRLLHIPGFLRHSVQGRCVSGLLWTSATLGYAWSSVSLSFEKLSRG